VSRTQNKIDFINQMKGVAKMISHLKTTPEQMGEILKAGAVPIRAALIQEWSKIDRTRLGGEVAIRPIIKQGVKRKDIIYIGPDWLGEKDYLWLIYQYGTVQRFTKGLRRAKKGRNKGQMIGKGKGHATGVIPARRFMDAALRISRASFYTESIKMYQKIMKGQIK